MIGNLDWSHEFVVLQLMASFGAKDQENNGREIGSLQILTLPDPSVVSV